MQSSRIWTGLVLLAAFGFAPAAPAETYPAAILPFQERGDGVKGYGAKISDVLFASLVASDHLMLVDRAELQKTLSEQSLSLSGLVKPDEAVRVGQLTGAKILITGSIIEIDRTMYLVAKLISTETGRTAGAKVKGKTSDDLAALVEQLAETVDETLAGRADSLVPKPPKKKDRIASLNKELGNANRPKVWVSIKEEHIGRAVIDPAAETEISLFCNQTGFEVVDSRRGSRKEADVLIEGEGFSEFATQIGGLVSVKARVEIKAIDRKSGKILHADRQTEIVVDLAERVAGKTALQNAAAKIAMRLLPKIVESQ